MVEKTMFETFDGKLFDNFAEAVDHEMSYFVEIFTNPNKVLARNKYGKEIPFTDGILAFLEQAQTINVKTEDAYYAFDYFSDIFPQIEFPSCLGMSRWDDEEKRWVGLEEDLSCLERKWHIGCLSFAVRGW